MFTIKEFIQPNTIEEAYNILVTKRNNALLGGTAFLRLGSKKISTAIDLSTLELSYIEERERYIEIGAFTTLREVETSSVLIDHFNGVVSNSLKNIIGVQLRNVVTIGATIFSKYGFSDLLTALLCIETEIELYKAGRMTLEEFLQRPYEKDILMRIFIKKDLRQASYQDLRNSKSDYPILNVGISRKDDLWRIAVGARPQRAVVATKASQELSNNCREENLENCASMAAEELTFGTNGRGTAEYRQAMCKVLVKRGIKEVLQWK